MNPFCNSVRWLLRRLVLVSVAGLVAVACGRKPEHAHDDHEEHEHSHEARHGGVAVVLGDEEFHVEFGHSEKTGVLQAFIFDGHMENYVRVATPTFAATAVVDGRSHPVIFAAVANAASGETIGDTAYFEAPAAWLQGRPALTLTVPALLVKGTTYTGITAAVPATSSP